MVVVVLLSVFAVLFMPIFLETNVYYDVLGRKFAFAVYGYKIIKLSGGYIATYNGGIAVHSSEKRAVLIPYRQLNSERKRFSFLKSFRLKSFMLTTETGAEYLQAMLATQAVIRYFLFFRNGNRRSVRNTILLTDGENLKITLRCTLFSNLFMLLRNFILFLREKLQIICRKRIKKSVN